MMHTRRHGQAGQAEGLHQGETRLCRRPSCGRSNCVSAHSLQVSGVQRDASLATDTQRARCDATQPQPLASRSSAAEVVAYVTGTSVNAGAGPAASSSEFLLVWRGGADSN